jgi:hypothetical protein
LPDAALLGIELDPLPAITARANLAAAGFAVRSAVILGDYRSVDLPSVSGRTFFVGNPPYVRHHLIGAAWKNWFVTQAAQRGAAASQLAGVLFRAVTKALELFRVGRVLTDASILRRVVDLPNDLDVFQGSERQAIDRFLRHACSVGAHLGYVAKNRKTRWSVGLKEAAPILATYMARRPPAFVRNHAAARHQHRPRSLSARAI